MVGYKGYGDEVGAGVICDIAGCVSSVNSGVLISRIFVFISATLIISNIYLIFTSNKYLIRN